MNGNKTKLIRPSEIPIYGRVRSQSTAGSETEPTIASRLELEIGHARHFVINSLSIVSSSKDRAVEIYDTGKAHSIETIAYLRDESNLLARVGAIAVGGLAGVLFGVRGGFFKKMLYGSVGIAAVSSLCYPKEAGQISKSAYTIAKYYALTAYKKVEDEVQSRTLGGGLTNKQDKSNAKPAVAIGDYGQSNPADKDMYTTRGN